MGHMFKYEPRYTVRSGRFDARSAAQGLCIMAGVMHPAIIGDEAVGDGWICPIQGRGAPGGEKDPEKERPFTFV